MLTILRCRLPLVTGGGGFFLKEERRLKVKKLRILIRFVIINYYDPVKKNRFFAALRKTSVCYELGEGGLSWRLRRQLSPPKNPNA